MWIEVTDDRIDGHDHPIRLVNMSMVNNITYEDDADGNADGKPTRWYLGINSTAYNGKDTANLALYHFKTEQTRDAELERIRAAVQAPRTPGPDPLWVEIKPPGVPPPAWYALADNPPNNEPARLVNANKYETISVISDAGERKDGQPQEWCIGFDFPDEHISGPNDLLIVYDNKAKAEAALNHLKQQLLNPTR